MIQILECLVCHWQGDRPVEQATGNAVCPVCMKQGKYIRLRPARPHPFVVAQSLADAAALRFEVPRYPAFTSRVLNGGFVQGSLMLLYGEPGCGKTSLALSIADSIARDLRFAEAGHRVVYVTNEQSLEQVKATMMYLGLEYSTILLGYETHVEPLYKHLHEVPGASFLVIDSISNLGSLSADRDTAKGVMQEVMRATRAMKLTTLLTVHVTKDGDVAGPRFYEHMVDGLLEVSRISHDPADGLHARRLLCRMVNKYRFGPIHESVLLEYQTPSDLVGGFEEVA